MTELIHWFHLKRNLIEIWLLNGAVALMTLTDIQTMLSIGLVCLTGAYTIWKWRRDIKRINNDSKNKNN